VRNLYLSPGDLVKADKSPEIIEDVASRVRQSSNVGIGGDSVTPGTLDVAKDSVNENVGGFDDALTRESVTVDNETNGPTIRPLLEVRMDRYRTEVVFSSSRVSPWKGVIQLSNQDRHTLSVRGHFLWSSSRYRVICLLKLSQGVEAALGAKTGDVKWDYQYCYMRFPGCESKRSGHVFNAFIHDLSQQTVETVNGDLARNSQMYQVLIGVDKDLATKKEHEDIIRMLNDKSLVLKFADSCGEVYGHWLHMWGQPWINMLTGI